MTNRIQSLRSNVAGARPAGQIPGTIYTNFADRQIGVVSPTNAPLDMVAVRFFSTTASYVLGDYVVNGGQIYRAPGPITPGVFNPGAWVPIGNAMFDQSLNTFNTVRFAQVGISVNSDTTLHVQVPSVNGNLDAVMIQTISDSANAIIRMRDMSPGQGRAVGMQFYNNAGVPVGDVLYGGSASSFPNAIRFTTSQLERMRIDAVGNVGIGTTPNWSLDIARTQAGPTLVQATNSSSDPAASVRFRVNNGTSVGDLQQFGSGTVPSGIFRPNMTLLDASGAGGLLLNAESAPIYFGTTNTERMRIDAAGNVGIGRPSTGAILDVYRNFAGSTHSFVTNDNTGVNCVAQAIVGNGTNGTGVAHFGVGFVPTGSLWQADAGSLHSSGVNGLVVWTQGTAPLRFGTNAIERMRIDAGGNVGIGMQPTNILDITNNTNAFGVARISNTNGGASAATGWTTYNGNTGTGWYHLGPGYTQQGTVRPDGLFITSTGVGGTTLATQAPTPLYFVTNSVERMRIDANGTVRVMNLDSSQQAVAVVSSDTANLVSVIGGSGSPGTAYGGLPNARQVVLEAQNASSFYIGTITGAAPIVFAIERAERGRFTTDGYFKASNFGTYLFGPGGTPTSLKHEFVSNKDGEECLSVTNSYGLNPYGLVVNFSGGTPNNATNYFYRAQDTAGARAFILANGGLSNYSANNSNLSDESVKDYITPYTATELVALEQSFTSVIWGKYKYRDQTHDDWNHGPTAQGVERAFKLTAPELVDEAAIGPKGETGDTKHKVVYETDLAHIGHALLARALTEIKELKAAIALLTGGKPASA